MARRLQEWRNTPQTAPLRAQSEPLWACHRRGRVGVRGLVALRRPDHQTRLDVKELPQRHINDALYALKLHKVAARLPPLLNRLQLPILLPPPMQGKQRPKEVGDGGENGRDGEQGGEGAVRAEAGLLVP
eukprot:CAMPEP_0206283354 /NCGR_PEP_ID=MMETSP0047_2-20121206/40179_1 /ASSEMBLY_ACC=CAM_ASM_000192 /TAXON_ID=195065 /ORGANISM="Chroomonas mesostigmatica_cf, Strain CCMP1168" /LENGTH=129 /DNA_ID=CAMNT_0053713701 /DNA_START=83 /DNA_END=468 /DNA_ORIENTATION=-